MPTDLPAGCLPWRKLRFSAATRLTDVDTVWIPLATTSSPPIVVSGTWLVSTSSTAAAALTIPAPAPIRPADGRNVLVSCSTAFVPRDVSDGLRLAAAAPPCR